MLSWLIQSEQSRFDTGSKIFGGNRQNDLGLFTPPSATLTRITIATRESSSQNVPCWLDISRSHRTVATRESIWAATVCWAIAKPGAFVRGNDLVLCVFVCVCVCVCVCVHVVIQPNPTAGTPSTHSHRKDSCVFCHLTWTLKRCLITGLLLLIFVASFNSSSISSAVREMYFVIVFFPLGWCGWNSSPTLKSCSRAIVIRFKISRWGITFRTGNGVTNIGISYVSLLQIIMSPACSYVSVCVFVCVYFEKDQDRVSRHCTFFLWMCQIAFNVGTTPALHRDGI